MGSKTIEWSRVHRYTVDGISDKNQWWVREEDADACIEQMASKLAALEAQREALVKAVNEVVNGGDGMKAHLSELELYDPRELTGLWFQTLDEALSAFGRAVELYPNSPANRANWAVALRAAGDRRGFEEQAAKALELDERTPHSDKKLSEALRSELRRPRARSSSQEAPRGILGRNGADSAGPPGPAFFLRFVPGLVSVLSEFVLSKTVSLVSIWNVPVESI